MKEGISVTRKTKINGLSNTKFEFGSCGSKPAKTFKPYYEDLDKKRALMRTQIEQTCSRLETMGIKGKADEIRKNLKF